MQLLCASHFLARVGPYEQSRRAPRELEREIVPRGCARCAQEWARRGCPFWAGDFAATPRQQLERVQLSRPADALPVLQDPGHVGRIQRPPLAPALPRPAHVVPRGAIPVHALRRSQRRAV